MNFLNSEGLSRVQTHIQTALDMKADKLLVEKQFTDSVANWNQNDEFAPDYVKNRTHYDSREYGGTSYTFNGDMSGYEAIDLGGTYLVKISEDTPTTDSLIGSTVKISVEGEINESTIVDTDITEAMPGVYLISNAIYLVHQEFSDGGFTLTPGIWVMCIPSDSVWVSEISSYGLISGELKQIDPKYLPGKFIESVNGIVPDENGTINLTSSDVDAGKLVVVNVLDGLVTDLSSEEILALINAGNTVYLKYGGKYYIPREIYASGGVFYSLEISDDIGGLVVYKITLRGNSVKDAEWHDYLSSSTPFKKYFIDLTYDAGVWSYTDRNNLLDEFFISDSDKSPVLRIYTPDLINAFGADLIDGGQFNGIDGSLHLIPVYARHNEPDIPKQSMYVFSGVCNDYAIEAVFDKEVDGVRNVTVTRKKLSSVTSWNDLEDKPFSEDVALTEIYRNTPSYFVSVDSTNSYYSQFDYMHIGINLDPSKNYYVEINKVLYEAPIDATGKALGNAALLNSSKPNTGELFYLNLSGTSTGSDYIEDGIYVANSIYKEPCEIVVYTGEATLKQLDEKYIPDTIARKEFVETEVAALVGSAPETLNTIEELATALNNNKDIVTVLNDSIATKANKADVYTKAEVDAAIAAAIQEAFANIARAENTAF